MSLISRSTTDWLCLSATSPIVGVQLQTAAAELAVEHPTELVLLWYQIDQWAISSKMVDPQPTRQLGIVWLLLAIAIGCDSYPRTETDGLAKWMAPLKQYGWSAQHLKNKVEHGDVTTFELGTPNYQILNPEDEPEYITADQPQYQQMLKELTSGQNGTDTIDVDMISKSTNYAPVKIPEKIITNWEKLKKRSFEPTQDAQNPEPIDPQSVERDVSIKHPNIQVFHGARPFQTRITNLS